jgi:hypothetical protein
MSFRIDLNLGSCLKQYIRTWLADAIFLIILPVLYIYNLICVEHSTRQLYGFTELVGVVLYSNKSDWDLYDPCQQTTFPQKRKAKSILE